MSDEQKARELFYHIVKKWSAGHPSDDCIALLLPLVRAERQLQQLAEPSNDLLEIGRLAVEDLLVEFRDDRLSVLRNNGCVIRERDGKESSVIRFGPETAIRTGLLAMLAELARAEEQRNGN